MPDKPWKATEREICALFGCQRRGPTGKDDTDCDDSCGLSVEIRHRKNIPFSMIIAQVAQAESRAKPGQIGISVASQPRMRRMDAIVSMRVETFLRLLEEYRNGSSTAKDGERETR